MTSIKPHIPGFCGALGILLALAPVTACGSKGDDPEASGGTSTTKGGTSTTTAGNTMTTGGDAPVSGSGNDGGTPAAGGSGNPSGGGGANAGGAAPASSCGPVPAECTAAAALMTMPFSDFETGKGWYLFANTEDKGGTTMPAAGDNIMAEEIACPLGGRCGTSNFSQHVSGGGFTTYGPSLSNDFLYKDGMTMMVVGMPMDASMFTGIMFWARKGDKAGAAPTLRLIVNDVTTHELGGVCDPKAAPGAGGMKSNACWDGWMTEKALPSTWTLVKVPFTVLKQGGFGMKGDAIQPDKLYGLTFQMPNMATFDFWIDDVAFYKE